MSKERQKEMFGFRAEKPLAERIKRFADEQELSESDALRKLVSDGLRESKLEDRIEELEERLKRLEER